MHAIVLLTAASIAVGGCASSRWRGGDLSPVGPELLRRELGLELGELQVESIPQLPQPVHLRPCCAFGSGIGVSVAGVPVPVIELANTLGPDELGRHTYDGGTPLKGGVDSRRLVTSEKNGLVYTCRAGFVDMAHLRLWADFTHYLAAWIAANLEPGGTLAIRDEGGERRIVLSPVDPELLSSFGRRETAVPIAQWVAWQLSVWHEIVTWYGWSHLGIFPELASTFSPEDFYSNILGIKLSGLLVYGHVSVNEAAYNDGMTKLISLVLAEDRLGGQPGPVGHAAAQDADGVWWDSKAKLPSKALVLRRYFDIQGNRVAPWRVTDIDDEASAEVTEPCGDAERHVIWLADELGGIPIRDLVELRIQVNDELLEAGFPLPEGGRQPVTPADFPELIEHLRRENDEEFGPGSDRPERDPSAGHGPWSPARAYW